tara:strand:+ start:1739 stop:3190 length:1452 start_codon:yes stop_codon:yes gene_type:complete
MTVATPPIKDGQLLKAINDALSTRKLEQYVPSEKQKEFHTSGADEGSRERLLMAANQAGKTTCAGMETAMHMTGQYPKWWKGKRYTKAVKGWAGSDTAQTTRDGIQRILLGEVGEWGTGALPGDSISTIKRNVHGVTDAVETILVSHVTGDTSRVTLKTYDQGRKRWQGETLDFLWFDEEPPLDIYSEGRTRTTATDGITYMTFTPLLGMTEVVRRLINEQPDGSAVIQMTIYDADHYSDAQRQYIVEMHPEHEREARTMGVPALGSGRVFPVEEIYIKEEGFQIPGYWTRGVGMDIGYDHPTAAVWGAFDADTDTLHIYDAYRVKEETPAVHSAAILARGDWIPVFWPHDALKHDTGGSCKQIAQQYRDLGVHMFRAHATHSPAKMEKEGTGGFGTEAGIQRLIDRMRTGRLKVSDHLYDWFEEYRIYHRKDGKVVKMNDDLMSATRILEMMIRHFSVMEPPRRRAGVSMFEPRDRSMGLLG